MKPDEFERLDFEEELAAEQWLESTRLYTPAMTITLTPTGDITITKDYQTIELVHEEAQALRTFLLNQLKGEGK